MLRHSAEAAPLMQLCVNSFTTRK